MINRTGLDRIRRPTLNEALGRFGIRWSPGGRVFLSRHRDEPPTQIGHIPTGGLDVDAVEFPAGMPPHVVANDLYHRLAITDSDHPDAAYVRAAFERAMMRVLDGPKDPIDIRVGEKPIGARLGEIMRSVGQRLGAVLGGIS